MQASILYAAVPAAPFPAAASRGPSTSAAPVTFDSVVPFHAEPSFAASASLPPPPLPGALFGVDSRSLLDELTLLASPAGLASGILAASGFLAAPGVSGDLAAPGILAAPDPLGSGNGDFAAWVNALDGGLFEDASGPAGRDSSDYFDFEGLEALLKAPRPLSLAELLGRSHLTEEVEVYGVEDGYEGSWFSCTVLSANDVISLEMLVRYEHARARAHAPPPHRYLFRRYNQFRETNGASHAAVGREGICSYSISFE
jgi:hypothetical protein